MLRIRAGSVHPVTAPPIEDGAVLVDDRGTIAAVGPNRCVPEPPAPGAHVLECPDAVLVPGLVNTHTHLELTHLAGRNSEPEFARWIRTIRALKDATPPDEFTRSAERGVRDGWASGARWRCTSPSLGRRRSSCARGAARSPTRSAPGASRCRRSTARRYSISCDLAPWSVQRGGCASTASRWTGRTSRLSGTPGWRWRTARARTAPPGA